VRRTGQRRRRACTHSRRRGERPSSRVVPASGTLGDVDAPAQLAQCTQCLARRKGRVAPLPLSPRCARCHSLSTEESASAAAAAAADAALADVEPQAGHDVEVAVAAQAHAPSLRAAREPVKAAGSPNLATIIPTRPIPSASPARSRPNRLRCWSPRGRQAGSVGGVRRVLRVLWFEHLRAIGSATTDAASTRTVFEAGAPHH
jgi:hypothetical protein